MLTITQKAALEKAWTNCDTEGCVKILKDVGLDVRCSTCSIAAWLIEKIHELIELGEIF